MKYPALKGTPHLGHANSTSGTSSFGRALKRRANASVPGNLRIGQSASASLRQLHLGHSLLGQQGAEADLLMSAARYYRYQRGDHLKPTVLLTIGL